MGHNKGAVMHQLRRVVFFAAALVIPASVVGSAASADTHVVKPGESIQAAVDAASPGDTVLVKAGEYYERVTIRTDGLTLRAQDGVTLEPPYSGYSDCYLPGHDVGICIVPADFDPTSGTCTTRVSNVTITGSASSALQGRAYSDSVPRT
jgi:hypothetical protein